MIRIQHCENSFGVATAVGVEPASEGAGASELRNALALAGVLCLRFQRPLEGEEVQALARLFGPIKDPVGRAKDGTLFRYSEPRQVIDSGFVMTDEIRAKFGELTFGGLDDQRPELFETFHTDDTYTRELVQDHAEANAPRCHHDWLEHDVLVWDNRSVQHKAVGNFPVGEPRRFWRDMIAGERPE